MKKFKILHLPTALYVWDYYLANYNGSTIFNRNYKHEVEEYLLNNNSMEIDEDLDAGEPRVILLYSCGGVNKVNLHEFEIIEVTDEEV